MLYRSFPVVTATMFALAISCAVLLLGCTAHTNPRICEQAGKDCR